MCSRIREPEINLFSLFTLLGIFLCLTVGVVAQVEISVNSTVNGALRIRICQIALGGSPIGTGAAAVAITEFPRYAALYPNISWEYSLLSKNGNVDDWALVTEVMRAASGCDAFLGPSSSLQAVAVAPLIDKVWVSDTAGSAELSDKESFPTFSRVTSTAWALGRALGAYAINRNWKQVSVLVSDDAYGVAVGYSFQELFVSEGGIVEILIPITTGRDGSSSLRDALQTVKSRAESRIILMAYSPGGAVVSQIIVEEGMHRGFVFMFGEVLCATREIHEALPGAICGVSTISAPSLTKLKRAVLTQPPGTFQSLSEPPLGLTPFTGSENLSPLSALTSDALGMLMKLFQSALAANSWNATVVRAMSATELIDWMRANVSLDGYSGPVSMDAKGDRAGGRVTVFQVQPGQLLPVASWEDPVKMTVLFPMDRDTYWLNSSEAGPAPSWQRPRRQRFEVDPVLLIGCATAGCFALIVVGAAVRLQCASEEAKFSAIRSGASWLLVGRLTLRLADSVVDAVSFVSVILREPPETTIFIGFYGALIIVSVAASFWEIQYMVRFFHISLLDEELTEVETLEWDLKLRHSHLINVLVDDIPMLVISSVVLMSGFDWLILANLVFSSVMLGMSLELLFEVARFAAEHDLQEERQLTQMEWLRLAATPVPAPGEGAHTPTEAPQVEITPSIVSSGTLSRSASEGSLPAPAELIQGEEGEEIHVVSSSRPVAATQRQTSTPSRSPGQPTLRRGHNMIALHAIQRGQKGLHASSLSTPQGNDLTADEVDLLTLVMEQRAPEFVREVIAKADADSVWLSSTGMTQEIFHAVFVQRLKYRLYSQEDENLQMLPVLSHSLSASHLLHSSSSSTAPMFVPLAAVPTATAGLTHQLSGNERENPLSQETGEEEEDLEEDEKYRGLSRPRNSAVDLRSFHDA